MTLATRIRISGAAVLLAGLSVPAGVLAAPKIAVDPAVIDLGVINEGNSYERFIEVKNDGDGVLVLEDVKTSCGCTAAAVDGVVELTAGQSQKVRVTFNSKNMDGEIHKKVTITTNDPVTPQVGVDLKADVHRPIRWEPKYLSVDRVGPKDSWVRTLELQWDKDLNVEVKKAYILGGQLRNKESELFDVRVQGPEPMGDRMVHKFIVSLQPGAKPQKLNEMLNVVTNQPAPDDTLKIMVRGEIEGRISVSPNFAVLRMVEPGEEATRDLTFTSKDGPFKILSAEVPDSPIKVVVEPHPSGRQYLVKLSYTGEEAGVNGIRKLIVKTDDPVQPEFEMSVRYQTRANTPAVQSTGAVGPK
ncbi:MAG: DUF1573 domain-containing protein [Gemmatimonadetes bacterium]|nr:DUF1573 domain-containing protein [Gemmatimonadota bacterium]